jgi:methylenetetrahydrofolate dehydrogenase (NADP+) / methenyltetrahydrofolate cyclohydrolase
MITFDGNAFAQNRELRLKQKVEQLLIERHKLKIGAILFAEDAGSQLYTRLKKEAAVRSKMEYLAFSFPMKAPLEKLSAQIQRLNEDKTITGIIIQKPARAQWMKMTGQDGAAFQAWWTSLVSQITILKDVDGLNPETLTAIKDGFWREEGKVLPATAQAVLDLLREAKESVELTLSSKYIILGKSDILGKPLYYELKNQGKKVEMIGTKELAERIASGEKLLDADVIVSATGHPGLITGDLIKENCVVIDVGEPKPDVDLESVKEKASFITPVPGGVGPMTVVCLLENCVKLVNT